jgi:glycosyltransferase involved in cell wall biosynthesis
MKIAFLGIKKIPASGGADRVVEKLLENYPDDHEYTVYLLRDSNKQVPSKKNVRYIYIPSLKGKHLKPFVYFFLCSLHCLLYSRYDIIHIHNSDFGFFGILLRMRYRSRIIGTFHGNPYQRQKWGSLARYYLKISEFCFIKNCDVLTSVSRREQINSKSVLYIPNGIYLNYSYEKPAFDFKAFGLVPHEYILFACGRLDPTKGLHHLVKAYKEGSFHLRLFVIGDFDHDHRYSLRIEEEVQGEPLIILHKQLVSETILRETMKNCAVFVFPSEIEAMSMVLLEAISSGCPVVCSDIRENIDIVGKEYPLLFHSGDPNHLREIIQIALSGDSQKQFLNELKLRIMDRFNWPTIVTQYFALYNELMP